MSRLRLLFLLTLIVLLSVSLVAGDSAWRLAPLNPDFIRFHRTARLPGQMRTFDLAPGLPRYAPSPVDLSHLTPVADSGDFPRRFDLRELGLIPGIRDQNGYPACQAFATMGMVEGMLLPEEALDLSEWHIYRYHGFDFHGEYGDYTGGNWQMNAAYLLRWSGPVSEVDSPYGSGDDPSALEKPPVKHIQTMRFFPPRRDALDNAVVKRHLMEHGPLYASILYESMSYNSASASHYFSGGVDSNHGVVVVGWDDDFDRRRFLEIAPGNGAFILRNSWGGQWGDGGYFYMSYYDTGFTPRMGVIELADADNYGLVYQHDPLGLISILGGVSSHAWGGNVFTAQEDGELAAVGFYLVDTNSKYTIRVYRGLAGTDPSSGQLYLEQSGARTHAGFYTIPLEQTIPLSAGERFAVAVHFQTPGTRYPIPVEYPVNGYSSAATASPGESFVSHDGVSWYDMTTVSEDTNVCIKAYTRFSSAVSASLSARLEFSSGWILRYPYVRVSMEMDRAGEPVNSVAVYRRTDGLYTYKVNEIPVSQLGNGPVEWLDTAVTPGRNYAYQIRCFGAEGRFLGRSEWAAVEVTQ